MQGLAHPDGEVATSKATASVNVPMGLSNYASKPLDEVASHGTGNPYMMQMSLLKDKKVMINVLKRAEGLYKLFPYRRKNHPANSL
jgi:(S)-2-hydroxy-acid oxidase